MSRNYSPYKDRTAWWVNPWLILMLAGELVVVAFAYVIASTIANTISGVILALFFCVFPFLTIRYFKESMIEPNYSIDATVIEETRKEIAEGRRQAAKEFTATEIELLREGKRIPVLEAIRLDPAYRKIHPFFDALEASELDPAAHEIYLRLQLPSLTLEDEGSSHRFLLSFLRFVQRAFADPAMVPLNPFFQLAIIEIYSLRTDDGGYDVPFAVASLRISSEGLGRLQHSGRVADLTECGEFRFEKGGPIQPHHGISASESRGVK